MVAEVTVDHLGDCIDRRKTPFLALPQMNMKARMVLRAILELGQLERLVSMIDRDDEAHVVALVAFRVLRELAGHRQERGDPDPSGQPKLLLALGPLQDHPAEGAVKQRPSVTGGGDSGEALGVRSACFYHQRKRLLLRV